MAFAGAYYQLATKPSVAGTAGLAFSASSYTNYGASSPRPDELRELASNDIIRRAKTNNLFGALSQYKAAKARFERVLWGVVHGDDERGCNNDGQARKTAILLPHSISVINDDATKPGEMNIANSLASQGFAIRTLGQHESLVSAIENVQAASPSSSVVLFDLDGRRGRELSTSGRDTRVAGLYSFKTATGMFQKV